MRQHRKQYSSSFPPSNWITLVHQQYTPVLLAVLLSCIALGHILTSSFCRLTLWPLISRGWKVHWRRVIVVGAVLGQVLQMSFDLSRVIKVSSGAEFAEQARSRLEQQS
jgi:hypothetical protein